MLSFFNKDRYLKILFLLFSIFFLLVAIAPRYRMIWLAESSLSVLLVLFLVLTFKKFRFSNWSYTMIFIFLILHTIGSYYSYSEMPLFDILKEVFNLSRNHYDRLVHFFFGFAFFFPVQEFFSKHLKLKGTWSAFLAFLSVFAFAATYELIEYFILFFAQNDVFGSNYLGIQGDIFDTQKDMALAFFGSLIAWCFALFKYRF